MDVCVRLFCIRVVLCASVPCVGLITPFKESCRIVYMVMKLQSMYKAHKWPVVINNNNLTLTHIEATKILTFHEIQNILKTILRQTGI
jgi:hypothetical protein